ncbi:MAG: hypothetical protein LBB65_07170 [Burkholderiales bacterium]|jgi:hypothetical protein|nr:hypothetical protein [Burkholderiales bacterium]
MPDFITHFALRDHTGKQYAPNEKVTLTIERARPLIAQGLISEVGEKRPAPAASTAVGDAALGVPTNTPQAAAAPPSPLAGEGQRERGNANPESPANLEAAQKILAAADAAVQNARDELSAAPKSKKAALTTKLNAALDRKTKAQAELDVCLAALEPTE